MMSVVWSFSAIRRRRWLRKAPRRLQTLEDSLSDDGGGDMATFRLEFHRLPDPGFLISGFLVQCPTVVRSHFGSSP
eukprot:5099131-Pyramimonas_sp.AAC.2